MAQGILSVINPEKGSKGGLFAESLAEKPSPKKTGPKVLIPEIKPPKVKKGAQKNILPSISSPLPSTPSLSPIEKRFAERAAAYGVSLHQFGYEFFRKTALPPSIPPARDYVLGPGDELLLYVIGNPPGIDLSAISRLQVDREGKIYLPGLGVFYVWGRTVAEAEKLLASRLKTNIRLTLGRLRTFPVYVSGEVRNPGAILTNGVEGVVEVLAKAGGIKKTGSLREITLTCPGTKKEKHLDLYRLLIQGRPLTQRMCDGGVLLIPPASHLAGLAGEVRRPGIYEFRPGETLADLLAFAGGILPSSYRYRVVLERFEGNQKLTVKELPLNLAAFKRLPLRDGDLVVIKRVLFQPENGLKITGYTPYPGLYAYRPGLTLKDFLTQEFFYRDTSLEAALLERHPPGEKPRYLSFSPREVFSGEFNLPLAPGDVIRLFPAEFYQPVRLAGCVEAGYVPYHRGLTLREALADKKFCQEVKRLKAEIYRPKKGGFTRVETVYLAELLIRNRREANPSLKPGDLVLIRELAPGEIVEKVTIAGYVVRPGTYPLRPGMRLSDLLEEAGGFREKAYPEGIVVFRESVAAMQRERLRRAVLELQRALTKEEAGLLQAELSPAEKEARKEAYEAQRRLLSLMEKVEVTGRITGLKVPKDLKALKGSFSDILLENGDRVYVPKEPANVLIFGEVNNPSALLYQKGLTVRDYIRRAGGFTKFADVKEIFVIKANGEATTGGGEVAAISWDEHGKRFVRGRFGHVLAYQPRPGEAIIVPTKIRVPVMWRPLIRDVIQIVYQSALTVYTITNL